MVLFVSSFAELADCADLGGENAVALEIVRTECSDVDTACDVAGAFGFECICNIEGTSGAESIIDVECANGVASARVVGECSGIGKWDPDLVGLSGVIDRTEGP
jgi:hypothetical protein